MKIGILGSGKVATTLAAGFAAEGHDVAIGSRTSAKLADFGASHPGIAVGDFSATAAHGDVLVLAVKGTVAVTVLEGIGAPLLAGKTIIDATNPIADAPPVDGVIVYFTGPNDSLMERLQAAFPATHFVKAFNSVGAAHMVHPSFAGGPPTMFICGDNAAAKATVTLLLEELGWEVADYGGVASARAIEPLCVLWCLPGMLGKGWDRAFKMLE